MSIAPITVAGSHVHVGGTAPEEVSGASKKADNAQRQESSFDKVDISDEAREKAAQMKSGKAPKEGRGEDEQGGAFEMKKSSAKTTGNADKIDAVDELKDTNSEIKKKKDELQQAKTAFMGSEEERAKKIKELKQDIDDLEETQKQLESKLSL